MTLRLPKLLDDGCVLQAGVDMHIWGTGDPGRIVLQARPTNAPVKKPP